MKTTMTILLALVLSSITLHVKADEGMWLPFLLERLNYSDMQAKGLQLTPSEIYSINHSSVKDAIVSLNNGASVGAILSDNGLLITSYSGAQDYIQALSTPERNIMKNGYWATTPNMELRTDNLTASILISIEDVTQKILTSFDPNMQAEDKARKIEEKKAEIIKEATMFTNFTATIKSFYEGNEYYLFVYEVYDDVRIVAAPSQQLGMYGGDADNWSWPRYKPDFAFFRIYMSPNGIPAMYSIKNIPFKPRKFLPISLKGVQKGDFTFTYGMPSYTDRFITSQGVNLLVNSTNSISIKIRTKQLDIIKAQMDSSDVIKANYSTKYYQSSNIRKYLVGQNENIQKMDIIKEKKEFENSFNGWVNGSQELKIMYGHVIKNMSDAYDTLNKYNPAIQYFSEGIMKVPEIFRYAYSFMELQKELKDNINKEKLIQLPKELSYAAKLHFSNYSVKVDKLVVTEMLQLYKDNIPNAMYPSVIKDIDKKYKGNVAAYVDRMFSKSIFASKDQMLAFLASPSLSTLENDVCFNALLSLRDAYRQAKMSFDVAQAKLVGGKQLFIKGILDMNMDKKLAPDANGTIRVSYGNVTDYAPAENKKFSHYSTAAEMLKFSEETKSTEFALPDTLKNFIKNKDFGAYGQNGDLHTCFLTNMDVSWGNAGSPVINGKGALVGVCFDVNWEATSSFIAFDDNLQRNVNTDIRYVLFITEKIGAAKNIISELTIQN